MFNEETHLEMDFLVLDLLALSLSEVNSPGIQVADIGTYSKWKAVTPCLPGRLRLNNIECVSHL